MDKCATLDAARMLQAALLGRERLDSLPDRLRPRDLAEGYAIQAALDDALGPRVGFKLAATSLAARQSMGLSEPIAGRLFAGLRCDPSTPLVVDRGGMGIAEAEFAFTLRDDLPLRDANYDIEEVAAAVATVHPAIELPDSRFRDHTAVGPAQIAADSALAGRFILGTGLQDGGRWDLATHPVRILVNGAPAATGSGANVMGGPLGALAWLASRSEPAGLRRGEIVLTGSSTVPVAIAPGDNLIADFGALGAISACFDLNGAPLGRTPMGNGEAE